MSKSVVASDGPIKAISIIACVEIGLFNTKGRERWFCFNCVLQGAQLHETC